MKNSDFLNLLLVKPVSDILVSGFIDRKQLPEFNPMYARLYFRFARETVEMYLGDDSKIVFKAVETIEPWFDVDEDDRFAVMSVYPLVFKTEQSVRILSASVGNERLSGLTVRYGGDRFERCVTFDPMNFFGFSFNP